MSAKLVISTLAVLVEVISSQCLNSAYAGYGWPLTDGLAYANDFGYGPLPADLGYPNWAYDGLGYGAYGVGPVNGPVVPASGGGFLVTCTSPIAPAGLSVASENVIEGILAVSGELPVLSAVALEGALPTIGSGTIAYGCGDGSIGIVSELAPKLPYAPQAADLPYSAGLPYRGLAPYAPATCGCGAY